MKTFEKILLSAAVAAFLTVICWMFLSVTKPEPQAPAPVVGTVIQGNALHGTTTSNQAGMANYRVIREGTNFLSNPTTSPGVIGTVNVTIAGSKFCLYDATSTRTNGEWATTTIQCFSGAVGSWPLDRVFYKGLLIEQTTVDTVAAWASTSISYKLDQTP